MNALREKIAEIIDRTVTDVVLNDNYGIYPATDQILSAVKEKIKGMENPYSFILQFNDHIAYGEAIQAIIARLETA